MDWTSVHLSVSKRREPCSHSKANDQNPIQSYLVELFAEQFHRVSFQDFILQFSFQLFLHFVLEIVIFYLWYIVNGILLEILPCPNNALLHRAGDFTGSLVRFSRARLYFFMGSHFALVDGAVNSLVGEKLGAYIKVNGKTNQPNWPGEPPLYPTRSHLLWYQS